MVNGIHKTICIEDKASVVVLEASYYYKTPQYYDIKKGSF